MIQNKLSEVSSGLLAAYDSGELLNALEEGHSGWQKWVKNFGKTMKLKVCALIEYSAFILPVILCNYVSEDDHYLFPIFMLGEISFHASPSVANWKTPRS